MKANRSLVRAACAALMTLTALAAPESPEIVDRYEQMLVQSPRAGAAFDRVCDAYVKSDGLDALDVRWTEKAKAENGAPYVVLRGLLAQRRGKNADAAQLFDEAVKRLPGKPEPLLASAAAEADAGRTSNAIERYEKALGAGLAGEERLDAMRRIAQLQQRMLKTDDAVKTLQRMAAEYPDDPLILGEAGDALVEAGRDAEARAIFEKLRDKQGGDAFQRLQAMLKLAQIERQAKGRDAALAIYEQVLVDSAPTSWIHRETRQRIEELFRGEDDLPGLAAYYEKRMKAEPADVEAVYRYASVLSELGKDEESAAQWRRAIELAPERREFVQEYARQRLASGKAAEAVDLLRRLSRDDPKNADLSEALGDALWSQAEASGKPEDRNAALDAWAQLAPPDSNDISRIIRVTGILARHDLKNEALPYYERALRIRPDSFDLREAWADILAKLGRRNDAEGVLSAGVAGDLATAENYLALAGVYRRLERTDDALAAVEAGLAKDPGSFDLLVLKARLLSEKEQWAAVADLHTALLAAAPAPHYVPELERQYLEALDNAGKLDEAQNRLLADFTAGKIADEAGLRLLARMLLRTSDTENARKVLDAAAKNFPNSIPLAQLESDYQERSGTPETRREILRKLASLDAGNRAQWLAQIAQLYQSEGKWDDALKVAQERIELSPANSDGYLFYADICFAANRNEQGIEKLQEALRIASDPVNVRLRLASAYSTAGNNAMALRTQEEAFTQESDPARKLQLMGTLAQYYLQENRIEELIARLESRQKAEEGARYSAYLAEIYLQMRDYAGAREELARSLAVHPRDAGLLQQLLRVSEQEGNVDERVRYARALAEVNPSLDSRLALLDALADSGAEEEAAALVREIGPEWAKQGGENAMQMLLNPSLRASVAEVLRDRIEKDDADWKLALNYATALIGAEKLEEADAVLRTLLAKDGSQFSFSAPPPSAPSAGGVFYFSTPVDIPPFLLRLNEVDLKARQTVTALRNLAEQQQYARFSGSRYRGAVQRNSVATPSNPDDVRNIALALRAYIAASQGREAAFLEEWKKSAPERGLSREQRIEELTAMQAADELRAETYAYADAAGQSPEQLQVAFNLLQRNGGRPGDDREKLLQVARRLLETEQSAGSMYGMAALQILYGADHKDEALRHLDRMIGSLSELDPTQLAQIAQICLAWDRLADARKAYAELMTRDSRSQGISQANNQAFYVGQALAMKMIQTKELRNEGIELFATIMRDLYGTSGGRVTVSALGMGRQARTLVGGMPVYMLSIQNLSNFTPLPTKWLNLNARAQLQAFWQQLHALDAVADFNKALEKQVAAGGADAIAARQVAIYFKWWEGDKKGAIEDARKLIADQPGENLTAFLASMLSAAGDYKAASELLANAPTQDRNEAMLNAILGISVAVKAKDRDSAKALAERFVKLRPQPDERSVVAETLNMMGLNDLAEKVQNVGAPRARSSEPALVQRLNKLGEQEGGAGREQAVAISRNILLSGTPGTLVSQRDNVRSSAISSLRRFQEFEPFFNQVQQLRDKDPNSVKWNALLAELAQSDSTERALPYLQKLAELRPDNVQLQMTVAQIMQSSNRSADAVKIYEKLMKADFKAFLMSGMGNAYSAFKEAGKQQEFADLVVSLSESLKAPDSRRFASNLGSMARQPLDAGDTEAALKLFRASFVLGNSDMNARESYFQILKQNGQQERIDREVSDVLFPSEPTQRVLMASMFDTGRSSPWNSWTSNSEGGMKNLGAMILDYASPGLLPELREKAGEYRKRMPDDSRSGVPELFIKVRQRDPSVLEEIRTMLEKSKGSSSSDLQSLAGELTEWEAAKPVALKIALANRDAQSASGQPANFVTTTMQLVDMAIECDEKEVARRELAQVLARFKSGGSALLNQLNSEMLFKAANRALDVGLARQAHEVLAGLQNDGATQEYIRRRIAQMEPEFRLAAGEVGACQAVVWQTGEASKDGVTLAWRLGPARPLPRPGNQPQVSMSMRDAAVLDGKYDLELIAELPPNRQQRLALLPKAKFLGRWTGKLPKGTERVVGVLRLRNGAESLTGIPIAVSEGPNLVTNPNFSPSTDGKGVPGWVTPLEPGKVEHGGPDGREPAVDIQATGRTVRLLGDPILLEPDQDYVQRAWTAALNQNVSVSVGIILLDENKKEVDQETCSTGSDRAGWRLATQMFTTRRNSTSGFRTISSNAKWMQPVIQCGAPTRLSGVWIGKLPITRGEESED